MATKTQPLNEEATTWFVRLQAAPAQSDLNAFERWMDDPANAVAFARVEATWERSARLQAAFAGAPVPAPGVVNDRTRASGFASAVVSRRAAAAIFLVSAASGVAWLSRSASAIAYRTAIGEQKKFLLEDGSSVHLNTDSSVSVRYSDHLRAISLIDGEAFFDIVKDAARPLAMEVRRSLIEAVGTSFNLRVADSFVEVIVSAGSMTIRDVGDQTRRAPVVRIAGGEGARIFNGAIDSFKLTAEQIAESLSWQKGIIEFEGQTLEQAIAQFNRYTLSKIVIADPSIASMRIGGTFETHDSGKFIDALGSLGVKATRGSDKTTYLSAA